jgi:hypothetical protein
VVPGLACSGEFTRGRISDEPLGIKLAEAGSDPGQRVKTLKEVGDTSLYVAGFFAESLGRKLVDVDYYVGLGSSAYHELASRLGGSITDVYRDLAERFPAFVEVLGEIRRSADFATRRRHQALPAVAADPRGLDREEAADDGHDRRPGPVGDADPAIVQ